MIALVDYGLGNIRAFQNVYRRLDIPAAPVSTPDELREAQRIILPGVGDFGRAMSRLRESGMWDALGEMVLVKGLPFLGVCVGMQMLGERSQEAEASGLGWLDGTVMALSSMEEARGIPVPHMGWNQVHPRSADGLFSGIHDGSEFYFLHSFYFESRDEDQVLAEACYGRDFPCAVNSGNIYGVQFHPEKSHAHGVQLLKNFALEC